VYEIVPNPFGAEISLSDLSYRYVSADVIHSWFAVRKLFSISVIFPAGS